MSPDRVSCFTPWRVHALPVLLASVVATATGCGVQGDPASPPESPPAVEPVAKAHYLANAGVLIARGDTKVVFDPLFRNDYGAYHLLPPDMERALFAGEPPLDGIDAVLISHYHEDHFSPADVLRLLVERQEIRLYAPVQAISGMRRIADGAQDAIFDRVREIALEYRDAPVAIEEGGLLIEAVRIPHSGWPERQLDVENIAYRVTLDATTTVLHLGDADTRDVHFAHDAEYWDRRHTDLAFPPYWYFLSEEGRRVLEDRLAPSHAVGVHVPVELSDRPAELEGFDLFLEPGETRDVPVRP